MSEAAIIHHDAILRIQRTLPMHNVAWGVIIYFYELMKKLSRSA